MTAPMMPQKRPTLSRKEARTHFDDAQIAEYLKANPDVELVEDDTPTRPAITRPRSDSFAVESSTTPATHRPDVTGQPNDWPELVREVGRGATFGLSDRAEAGVRALGDETYSGARDEQKRNRAAFQGRNPITSAVANAAGGIATGGLVMKGMAAVPGVGRLIAPGMTAGSRIGSAAASGAIQGGVAGALSADGSLSDRAIAGGKGALVGGALSGGLSAAAEVLRGVPTVARGVRDAYQRRGGREVALDPNRAALETLPIAARGNKTVEELRALDATTDPRMTLAELIDGEYGNAAGATVGSGHRYGFRPKVEEVLLGRAKDEAGGARRALERNGIVAQNQKVIEAGKLAEARAASSPLFEQALEGRNVTDPKLVELVGRPSGGRAYNDARTHMLDRGESTMPALDDVIARAKGPALPADPAPMPPDVPRATAASTPAGATGDARRKMSGVPVEELSLDQLRKMRTSRPVDSMTDRQLAAEHHYLNLLEAKDSEAAAFLQLPVHDAISGTPGKRMLEDRLGVMQEHGFQDPTEFAAAKFRAVEAAQRMQKRASKLQAVQEELTIRKGLNAPTAAASAETSAGLPALDDASRARSGYALPDQAAELPTIPARKVQSVKRELDAKINRLDAKGETNTEEYRSLIGLRDGFDNLLYEHAPGYDKAMAAHAKPLQELDAFKEGRKAAPTMDETDVDRLLALNHPDYVAKGVGSSLHRDLSRLPDGRDGGPIRNPAGILGEGARGRAKIEVATQRDPVKMADIAAERAGINRRFKSANKALAGSPSAARLAEDLQAMGGDVATNVAQGKFSAALDAITKPVNLVARGASLDRRNSLLLAMGQDRTKALDLMEAARPLLLRSGFTQAGVTSSVGRLAGGAVGRANNP